MKYSFLKFQAVEQCRWLMSIDRESAAYSDERLFNRALSVYDRGDCYGARGKYPV